MMDKKTEKELADNIRARNRLREEFEARIRYHHMHLGLGDDVQSQQIAEMLAISDMRSGDKERIDHTATAKPQPEYEALERAFRRDPRATMSMLDRQLKPKKR